MRRQKRTGLGPLLGIVAWYDAWQQGDMHLTLSVDDQHVTLWQAAGCDTLNRVCFAQQHAGLHVHLCCAELCR